MRLKVIRTEILDKLTNEESIELSGIEIPFCDQGFRDEWLIGIIEGMLKQLRNDE